MIITIITREIRIKSHLFNGADLFLMSLSSSEMEIVKLSAENINVWRNKKNYFNENFDRKSPERTFGLLMAFKLPEYLLMRRRKMLSE